MDKQAFKQRMQNLKSYRENNPGKGYWDWKVQAYQNGGDIPLWQQYQYSGPSYQDVLDDLKQNSPSTYNQLQQSKAADSQSSSEIVRYVDSKGRLQSTSNLQGLSPVITSDYLPGIGDAMEVTQIVQDVKNEDYGAALAGLGLLALPGNWLSKIKSKYGKKGLVNSIYNNVAPGSYYDSYIPGGSKKDELKGALKDYLLGKGDKIDPKWENWINSPTTLGSFIAKDNKKQQHMLDVMTAARKEAWQNYLGIPHDDRYLINTGIKENGMPVYRSNVTDVPNVQLRDIAKTTQHKPESIPYVHGDMINSTGGNISVKYKDNGDLRTITTEDIWDLNPFKDANRARILPEWLKNKYMHIEVQPDGYQKRVWNDNAPKWLIDLEPANLLGIPGPFLNRTTFNARLLNKDQAVKKVPISKEEYVNKRFGTELELIDPSEMTDKEFQKWKKLTQNRYSEEYDRLNEQQSERLFEFVPKTEEELLDKYGIYVKKYSDGGEVSEFQRKTRRDIMQESLVDGRPDYNKMFQNQNEYQKDFANYWYTERAKNPKYSDQIGGDKLGRTPDGRPKEQGLKPVIDLEDAVNVTPIGDVLSAKDAYNAARNNDWLGVGLATATMIPFVPRAISTVRRSTPTVKNYRSSLSNALDKAVKLGEKERRMSARLNNETYETVQRLMDDPSYMRRAQQVKEKYGDDYTQIYADLIDAYNNSPELLPKAKRTAFEDNARARMATTTESTKRHMDGGEFPKMGEYEYQYDINGVPYGTTIHEMNHNADYLKNKAADADANSNLYYWMRSALKPFSRIDPNTDKLTKYYSKPTEQKAYMNQLREFMYANKMIDTRDQIVTPDLIKQAISKLPKGMQSIKKASEQFKSMRSYTKWFNTIPLLGVGAVGANKYFTSNENRD